MSVPLKTSAHMDGIEWNFVYIIWGPIKTDYNNRKSEIGNLKIGQNRNISKPGPSNGANERERPKGERAILRRVPTSNDHQSLQNWQS